MVGMVAMPAPAWGLARVLFWGLAAAGDLLCAMMACLSLAAAPATTPSTILYSGKRAGPQGSDPEASRGYGTQALFLEH